MIRKGIFVWPNRRHIHRCHDHSASQKVFPISIRIKVGDCLLPTTTYTHAYEMVTPGSVWKAMEDDLVRGSQILWDVQHNLYHLGLLFIENYITVQLKLLGLDGKVLQWLRALVALPGFSCGWLTIVYYSRPWGSNAFFWLHTVHIHTEKHINKNGLN